MHYLCFSWRGPTIPEKRTQASGSATERKNWCRICKATMTISLTRSRKRDSPPYKAASTYGIDQQGTKESWMKIISFNMMTWEASCLRKASDWTKIIKATCIQWLKSRTQTMKKYNQGRWSRNDSDPWWKGTFQIGRPWIKSRTRVTSV